MGDIIFYIFKGLFYLLMIAIVLGFISQVYLGAKNIVTFSKENPKASLWIFIALIIISSIIGLLCFSKNYELLEKIIFGIPGVVFIIGALIICCLVIYECLKWIYKKGKHFYTEAKRIAIIVFGDGKIYGIIFYTVMYLLVTYLAFTRNDTSIHWIFSLLTVIILGAIYFSIFFYIVDKVKCRENTSTTIFGFSLLFFIVLFFFIPNWVHSYNINQLEEKYSTPYRSVYVTSNGNKYHYFQNCRSIKNSENIRTIDLGEAISQGFSECKICAKKVYN